MLAILTHVATYKREDKTALMMGHSVKMPVLSRAEGLDRHYRKPLHRSHVKEFWSLLPQKDTSLPWSIQPWGRRANRFGRCPAQFV